MEITFCWSPHWLFWKAEKNYKVRFYSFVYMFCSSGFLRKHARGEKIVNQMYFSGYVTYNYQWDGFQQAKIELLVIHINDIPISEFSEIMPSNHVKARAKQIINKLREVGFYIISEEFSASTSLHFSKRCQEKSVNNFCNVGDTSSTIWSTN